MAINNKKILIFKNALLSRFKVLGVR